MNIINIIKIITNKHPEWDKRDNSTGGRGRLLRNRPLLIRNSADKQLLIFHSAVDVGILLVSEAHVRERDRRPGAISRFRDIRTSRTVPDLDVEQELRPVQGVTCAPGQIVLSYLKSNILVRYWKIRATLLFPHLLSDTLLVNIYPDLYHNKQIWWMFHFYYTWSFISTR